MDLLFVQFSQPSANSSVLGQDYPQHFGMERRAFCLLKSLRTKISLIRTKPTDRPGLTFKNPASYIEDGRTATLQMLHFIYFFNNYKY